MTPKFAGFIACMLLGCSVYVMAGGETDFNSPLSAETDKLNILLMNEADPFNDAEFHDQIEAKYR